MSLRETCTKYAGVIMGSWSPNQHFLNFEEVIFVLRAVRTKPTISPVKMRPRNAEIRGNIVNDNEQFLGLTDFDIKLSVVRAYSP